MALGELDFTKRSQEVYYYQHSLCRTRFPAAPPTQGRRLFGSVPSWHSWRIAASASPSWDKGHVLHPTLRPHPPTWLSTCRVRGPKICLVSTGGWNVTP